MTDERLNEPVVSFRPSYSATTLNCPGSLRPSLNAPDTAGYDAAVGTVFHELLALWLTTGRKPDHLLGRTRVITKPVTGEQFKILIDDDMFVFGQACVDRYADIRGKRYVEVKVDISSLTPITGQTGTADLVICDPGVLDVVDWKYGTGVKVFAKENTQGLCYAWGAFVRFDGIYKFRTIRIHIGQPRLGHYDVWEIDRVRLYEFARWARKQWSLAWSGKGPRVPSPHACQWCRVRTRCAAHQALLEAIVDDTFEVLDEVSLAPEEQQAVVVADNPDVTLTPPSELSTERLAWIYQYRKQMEDWFKEIGEELLRRGLEGDDLGGLYKVGQGRQGNRAWTDEERAANALMRLGIAENALWSRSLVSPKQVEGLLRAIGVKGKLNRDYLAMFTERAPGKLTLMPASDERMSIEQVVDETFEELE